MLELKIYYFFEINSLKYLYTILVLRNVSYVLEMHV